MTATPGSVPPLLPGQRQVTIGDMMGVGVEWGGAALRTVVSCAVATATRWQISAGEWATAWGLTPWWTPLSRLQPIGSAPRSAATRPGPTAGTAAVSDRLVVLLRDPWSLFAYWDLSASSRIEHLRALGAAAGDAQEALRVSVHPGGPATVLALPPGTTRRYVRVEPPGRQWQIEFGLQTRDGTFVSWLVADPVTTPPAAASPDTTVQWVTAVPTGPPVPASSTWDGVRVPPAESTARTPLPSSHSTPPG